ncbi:TolC family protein [Pandoraea pneumonica]|jgi:cobalt-zinc-cadmium efflux system outer membrane protein|nr:TolC family protein [Pandoraea pneumonica]
MKITLYATGVAMLLLGTATASAQPAVSPADSSSGPLAALTLAQAMRSALENNIGLKVARREIDAQSGALLQASARPNPELSVLQEDFRSTTRTTTAQLTQPIELGGQRKWRVEAGSAAQRAAELDAQASEAAVRSEVVARYYETLASAELVDLATQTASIAQETHAAVQRRVKAGKVSPVDEGRAQIAANNAQIELASANAARDRARARLAQVLSVGEAQLPGTLSGSLDALPSLPEWSRLAAALDITPAVRSASEEIQRRDALAKLESAQRIPDLSVTLGLKRVTDGGRTDNQAVVGLSIPLPIFDTRRGATLEAVQRADIARDAYLGVRQQQQATLTSAYAEFTAAREATRRLRDDILPQAQSAYDATRRGFLLGKFGFLDVLDAQRTLAQARSQYITSVASAYSAYATVGLAVGGSVDGVSLLSPELLTQSKIQ